MAQKSQIQNDLLSKIPPGTKMILVKTEKGLQEYKTFDEISDTDEIQTKKNGDPVVMKSIPGRRKAVVVAPVTPIVGELMRRKAESLEHDPILQVIKAKPDDPDVLHQVVMALGVEAASLGFEREEAERNGSETSSISIRRVKTLTTIGDTWLKRKDQIISRGIDMNTPAFEALLKFIMESFKGALEDCGARAEMIETVFSKMAKSIGSSEWQSEAKARMKSVV